MELKFTNSRGYELASFLNVAPKQIGNLKNFAKVQRFRLAVEKALGEYKKTLDDYQVWRANELKPYQEELKEFQSKHADKELGEEKIKAKQKELDEAYLEHIKDRADEAFKYETDNAAGEFTVTVNDEDLNQVKSYFEEKGHEFPFWATYPTSYMEVATSLKFEL